MEEGRVQAYDVDNLFRSTHYAQHLKATPRWSRYQPGDISNETWREILHSDSDGLDQARLMIGLTHAFLSQDIDNSAQLSDEDRELLFLSAAVQNWGKVSGEDISYEFLTNNHISERSQNLHKLLDELLPSLGVKRRFIIEKTLYDRTTRLGEVFDAIRRLNCLRTALIAHDKWTHDPNKPGHENLGSLSIGVLSNQLTYLIEYGEKFTPVRNALTATIDKINAIFADKTARSHPFMSQQQTIEAAERAEILWSRSHGDKSSPDTRGEVKKQTIFSPESLFEKRYIDNKVTLQAIANSLKALGMRIVLTSGSFDLLHVGHAKYIEKAAEYGDVLIVGVDSDEKIKSRKGPTRPIVGEDERLRLLSHLRGVGLLTLKHPDEKKWGLIDLIKPDILIVTAETYTADEIKELENGHCGRVIVLEPQATTSTTAKIRQIEMGGRSTLLDRIESTLAEEGIPEDTRRRLGKIVSELQR